MRFASFARLAFVFVPFIAACEEDNEFGIGLGGDSRFTASLSGANVRPSPVTTTATASADLSVREPEIGSSQRTLAFTLTASNLPRATAAHVHLGGSAVANGPILLTLFTNPTDTALTSSQLAAGSVAANGVAGGVSFDSLVTLMRNGRAYIDVHTTASPNGLIRGQIVRTGQDVPGDLFAASGLAGSKERPTPVVSTASGAATFELLPGGSMRFSLSVAGLTGATMAHIHTGVADSAGPIAVPLFSSTTPTGAVTGVLTSGSFTASSIQLPGVSLDSLLGLMRRGRTYVNVHTTANPLGEIRAQIEPVSTLP